MFLRTFLKNSAQYCSSKPQEWVTAAARSVLTQIIFIYLLLHIISVDVCKGGDDNGYSSADVGYFLCRKCGTEVAEVNHLVWITSKLALHHRNESIGSKRALIQHFKNPNGDHFEVMTFDKTHAEKSFQKHADHSFFPGFAWSFARCPRCGAHIGWGFDSIAGAVQELPTKLSSFVALILDNVMREQDALDLIAVPKAYAS